MNEIAVLARSWMAIDSSAMAMRSPAVTSMSSSRRGGLGGHLSRLGDQGVGGLAHGADDDDDCVTCPVPTDTQLGDLA